MKMPHDQKRLWGFLCNKVKKYRETDTFMDTFLYFCMLFSYEFETKYATNN